jgi:hypothetical protein
MGSEGLKYPLISHKCGYSEESHMKKAQPNTPTLEQSAPSRRGFFMGAAAASAAAVAVTTLPNMGGQATQIAKLPPAPENGGGYSLSEHVKRYYQTTRV